VTACTATFRACLNLRVIRQRTVPFQRQEDRMRIFVAGATGAVGRALIPALRSAGHAVTGMTRSPQKTEAIRRMGAEPAVADGLDAKSVRAAVMSAKPDIVIDEMTDLAGATDLRHFDRAFAVTNRLRTEGTDHLLAAARDAGARRLIAQSFCGWAPGQEGEAVGTEADAPDQNPPRELRRTLDALRYIEQTVTASTDVEGIVLRYGSLYGSDTGMLAPVMREALRHRRVPLIGNSAGWWSFLHVEDDASAAAAAIEHGRAGAIYSIVDDEPAQVRDWLPALAASLDAKPPRHVPAWIARFLAGEHMVVMMTQVKAASNAKAKQELGWQPAHPSWRQGFAEAARQSAERKAAA
jgi:nucleoside-diphosphate-sugar epimerase